MRRWLIGMVRMAVVLPIMALLMSFFMFLMELMWTHPLQVQYLLGVVGIIGGAYIIGPSDPKEGLIPKWEDQEKKDA